MTFLGKPSSPADDMIRQLEERFYVVSREINSSNVFIQCRLCSYASRHDDSLAEQARDAAELFVKHLKRTHAKHLRTSIGSIEV